METSKLMEFSTDELFDELIARSAIAAIIIAKQEGGMEGFRDTYDWKGNYLEIKILIGKLEAYLNLACLKKDDSDE